MCGIFGFAGQSSWKTSLLLQSLCIADEIRGKDSTGLVVQNRDECLIKKKALRGKEFVGRGFTEFLFKSNYSLALGHNRLATTGKVTHRNAHPFGVRINDGWCFGVHNGVIRGQEAVVKKYGIEEPDVDSEVVFWAIAKMVNEGRDLSEAIIDITKYINPTSDYAFAYLDTQERDIYLWRSEGRPLVILDARKLKLGRWFSSTKEIFTNAWQPLRGAMGPISKITYQDAKPHRLYRLRESGVLQVVTDIQVPPKKPIPPEPEVDWSIPNDEYEDLSQIDLFAR